MTLQKQTIKRIEKALEDEGWVLLSAYYNKNKRIRIRYLCSKNHENEMTWSNFQAGCRCKTCNVKRVTEELVKEEFAKVGWTLLEKYKNTRTYMKCECSKGHVFQMSWASFIRGTPCKRCERGNNIMKEVLKDVVL